MVLTSDTTADPSNLVIVLAAVDVECGAGIWYASPFLPPLNIGVNVNEYTSPLL